MTRPPTPPERPPSPTEAADAMRARLKADLASAIKRRESLETSVLRTLLAAIDNAEAVPEGMLKDPRATEVPRLGLSASAVLDALRAEQALHRHALAEFTRLRLVEPADRSAREIAVIDRYLKD